MYMWTAEVLELIKHLKYSLFLLIEASSTKKSYRKNLTWFPKPNNKGKKGISSMLLVDWLFRVLLHWTKIPLLLKIKHDWEEIDYGRWAIGYYDKSLKLHKQNQKKDEAACVLSFLCAESAMCHTAFSLSMWTKKNCVKLESCQVAPGLYTTVLS